MSPVFMHYAAFRYIFALIYHKLKQHIPMLWIAFLIYCQWFPYIVYCLLNLLFIGFLNCLLFISFIILVIVY